MISEKNGILPYYIFASAVKLKMRSRKEIKNSVLDRGKQQVLVSKTKQVLSWTETTKTT